MVRWSTWFRLTWPSPGVASTMLPLLGRSGSLVSVMFRSVTKIELMSVTVALKSEITAVAPSSKPGSTVQCRVPSIVPGKDWFRKMMTSALWAGLMSIE